MAELRQIGAKARFDDEPEVAEEKLKPNTLSPKQIAEGAVLLFDGESTFGWAINGEAKVKDGWLVLGGDKATKTYLPKMQLPDNYKLTYEALRQGGSDNNLIFTTVRMSNEAPNNYSSHGSSMEDKPVCFDRMSSRIDGNLSIVEVSHGGGSGWRSNKRGTTPCLQEWEIAIPAGCTLHLRNVKLKFTQPTPLFNGKDLAGWKKFMGEPARAKSEFGVNKNGELTITNGPGDLQTEKSFNDFILQVDCKTNGKNLNSGVFFRCRPGEYQSGYEVKIHNGWTDAAEKEYTLEEFDPRTNETKDPSKILSAAIDYGTGAIYRRVPARKAVAKDNEWFTMTVMAQGRHIATWVNGVQVVDWRDNRPHTNNARTGCRLEPGPISLQGHDATTDLSFRNIRITELPRIEKKE